jgi:hypothetical protein
MRTFRVWLSLFSGQMSRRAMISNWKSRLCCLVSLIRVSHVLLMLVLLLAQWEGRRDQEYRG